jgi:hypothetical protein
MPDSKYASDPPPITAVPPASTRVTSGARQAYLTQLGQRVIVQWWGRDNTVAGSFPSHAVQHEMCPDREPPG